MAIMIQEQASPARQMATIAEQASAKMTSQNSPTSMGNLKKSLKDRSVLTLDYGFESRGSAMLRAALTHQNLKTPDTKRVCLDLLKHAQQVVENSSLRRTPNKVIFTEPLVTDSFEYEPTDLLPEDLNLAHQLCSTDNDESDKILVARKARNSRQRKMLREKKHKAKDPSGFFTQNKNTDNFNDEDDNELFIMAPTSFQDPIPPPRRKKNPKKRPLEEGDQNDENNGSEEGLFSSPKVAKIAPYYHDKESCKDLNKVSSSSIPKSMQPSKNHSSANQLLEPCSQNEVQHHIQAQHGYVGWFASGFNYLSNQMNKLLF